MHRAALRSLVLVAVLLGAPARARAQAQKPLDVVVHRFEYEVVPGAVGCPDQDFIRNYIAGNLGGRDPFSPTAAPRLVLRVWRAGQGYRGRLSQYDAAGESLGDAPELGDATCLDVVKRAGLIASPWLLALPRPPAPQQPPKVPAPEAPPPKPPEAPSRSEIPPDDLPPVPPPKPPPAPKLPIVLRVGAMVRVDVTPQTAAAFGVSGDVGIVGPGFSIAALVHAVPSARSTSGLDASLVAGGLLVCWRPETKIKTLPLVVPLCAIGEAGALQQQGGSQGHLGHPALSAGGGLHLAVEIPLGTTGFHLSPAVDALYVVQGALSNAAGTGTSGLAQPSATVSGGAFGAGLSAGYSFGASGGGGR